MNDSGNPCFDNNRLEIVKGKLWRECRKTGNKMYSDLSYSFTTYVNFLEIENIDEPVLVRVLRLDTPVELREEIIIFYKELGYLIEEARYFIARCQMAQCKQGVYSCMECGEKTNMKKFKIEKTKKWLFCPSCKNFVANEDDYYNYKKMQSRINEMMRDQIRWSEYKDYYIVHPK